MLALLLASGAGVGLLVWHMQRRAPVAVKLSFARLLPEPPISDQAEQRFALTVPLRSAGFWMRMFAVLAALAALMLDMDRRWAGGTGAAGAGIGLRIVLDVTHSMGLPEAGGTRLDAARAVADAALAQLAAASGEDTCAEVILVGASAGTTGLTEAVSRATLQPEGGEVATLVDAAARAEGDCPLTHVLVLTDARQPAMDWPVIGAPPDAPDLLWHQIGAPMPNTGLRGVSFTPPGLGSKSALIRLVVAGFGTVPPPVVWLEGPGGRVPVAVHPSLDRDQVWLGEAKPEGAGRYVAVIGTGGAYGGDDRLAFDVPAFQGMALDWRMTGLSAPRGAQAGGGDAVLVADLAALTPKDFAHPLLAVYPGWPNAGSTGRIGAFVQDTAVLAALNLDTFERLAPRPLQGALPPGFAPVLTDAAGAVYIARRATPPGLIVPAPMRDGAEIEALSLTLFFTALSDLAGRGSVVPGMEWLDAQGQTIANAAQESDTARALAPPPALARIAPRPRPVQDAPVWPLLALAALAALLAERGLMLWRGMRHAV